MVRSGNSNFVSIKHRGACSDFLGRVNVILPNVSQEKLSEISIYLCEPSSFRSVLLLCSVEQFEILW